jgi:hypothetical protein
MRTGLGDWTMFVVFGALIWLAGTGPLAHPAYRLVLMLAALSWAGYIAWTPKSS